MPSEQWAHAASSETKEQCRLNHTFVVKFYVPIGLLNFAVTLTSQRLITTFPQFFGASWLFRHGLSRPSFTFSEIQDGDRRHLGFLVLSECGHSSVLIGQYLCSVPNLVPISVLVTEIDAINFRFQLLVTWSSPRRRGASSNIIWCNISLSSPELLTFFLFHII